MMAVRRDGVKTSREGGFRYLNGREYGGQSKKRSEDMVMSWIESLPNRKENLKNAEERGEAGSSKASSGGRTEGSTFSSLSIVVPETHTNVSRSEDIIELSEEEVPYFASFNSFKSEDARTAAEAPAAPRGWHKWWKDCKSKATGIQSLSLSSLKSSASGRNQGRRGAATSKRRRSKAISKVLGNYGCYSIRTNSTGGGVGEDQAPGSAATAVAEDLEKGAFPGPKSPQAAEKKSAEDCKPSIERADKMSFHVPSSFLTLAICAFQFTQSSGLLLSFYLFML
ncbi:hypothetical protein HOP50_14g73760 [Chloropicon primus]|uniref:Uncharacterized protein n=1 Tax=Chloropicon primus TaxID=1764295 RepID=A0A5B8MZJ4_9CHLO|nr:hypothetical protein A3770_14p73520 [Chloropicon primus]UPR04043.1 hypothetical protein HOP50_14g73760 [Chloropicon primus]|mmetsp:Transcript_3779/g.10860  ORF Transcript_3779/g.10860 Transcript_3779/m.10860 type:complete len:282 (+) Transcript_3779:241-1086(+)|eukprot:QDZ24834.1 hypothetical protein A3770_14p73520 [Chloropicon primus]